MIPTKEQIEDIACIEQRSLNWFRARMGCITGSCVHFVMKLSDAEKALDKAIAAGPQFIETKTEFNSRLSKLKNNPELYEKAKAIGQLRESEDEFRLRLLEFVEKAKENPFPDTTVSYLYQLASERNLRDVFVKNDAFYEQYILRTSFSSSAIRWGEENEEMARLQYSNITGREVAEIGFYRHDSVDWYGDSPDGLILNNDGKPVGALEIKCPKPETWIRYRHEFRKTDRLYNSIVKKFMEEHPEIDSDAFTDDMLPSEYRIDRLNEETLKRIKPEYYWQCQSHCACNKVDWCDFVFYDPMQKGEIVIVRINKNNEDIGKMLARIQIANKYIDEEILS
jgi:hypothetical protein